MLETMSNPELWAEGGVIMGLGMGVVFSFLVIMVFAILIMTKVVAFLDKVCPVQVAEVKQAKKATSNDAEVALAIAVAASK